MAIYGHRMAASRLVVRRWQMGEVIHLCRIQAVHQLVVVETRSAHVEAGRHVLGAEAVLHIVEISGRHAQRRRVDATSLLITEIVAIEVVSGVALVLHEPVRVVGKIIWLALDERHPAGVGHGG